MKKETAVVRIMVAEELRDAMEAHYRPLYTKQWSDGLKADLYEQFGIEAPQPPSELDLKLEQMKRLEEEVAKLQKLQDEMDASKAKLRGSREQTKDSPPAEPAKPEQSSQAKTPEQAKSAGQAKAPEQTKKPTPAKK